MYIIIASGPVAARAHVQLGAAVVAVHRLLLCASDRLVCISDVPARYWSVVEIGHAPRVHGDEVLFFTKLCVGQVGVIVSPPMEPNHDGIWLCGVVVFGQIDRIISVESFSCGWVMDKYML